MNVMNRPLQAVGRRYARRARAGWMLALFLLLGAATAGAAPFIWDQDDDGVDDRLENVHLLGYSFSFEGADTTARQRIEVTRVAGGSLAYGVYVLYDHPPTSTDITALTLLGMPVLHRYEALPALRSVGSFVQLQAAAALAGVTRVEAVPVSYPMVRDGCADLGVRDATSEVFPTWSGTGGADGTGQVIAFLDTGINDAPDGTYPGHESLIGKFVGGASFINGDSVSDTPLDGSINPDDHGGTVTQSHATHLAGIALGTGGASGFATGVAPGARFVDVKVLTDAGTGTELSEAIDWCVHNRARNWGVPGYTGIDVINLSLSSVDQSDGNDFASLMAERAAQLGITVVASMGNDGRHPFVPSPAAARGVIAVGAMDDARSAAHADDQWSAMGNYGPRADDGDGQPGDEQKPDLVAPGLSILSADGALTSDGAQYHRLSGTSMSAAFVSGMAAALKSEQPSLTPGAVANLLRYTARRDLAGTPAGASGSDPRWSAPLGFGVPDLYAARLELEQPDHTQVEGLALDGAGGGAQIAATLLTQRERNVTQFVFERAPDVGGAPGAFAALDSVPAAGDSSLALTDRHAYPRAWTVAAPERGVTFWYRIAWWEGATHFVSPARSFTSPTGPPAATIELTVIHNAWDHDVTGSVTAGASAPGFGPGTSATATSSAFSVPLPGTRAAVSSDWVNGVSTLGNIQWTFHIDVPQGAADADLPPSASTPWWLALDEAGYLNRSGRLTGFRVIWHTGGGDQVFEGGPVPQQTVEGHRTTAAVPNGLAAVGTEPGRALLGAAPNPVAAGGLLRFSVPAALRGRALTVFDASGRAVARVPLAAAEVQWQARSASGAPLSPGLYFARAAGVSARFVVLQR